MYISINNLNKNMGVDEEIARFFVDRKVPADNIFWRGRYLYITRGNGYVSIPVYYDLLYRIGLPKESFLNEIHVQFMEQLMHQAMLVEFRKVSFKEQLEKIGSLLSGRIKNTGFYNELLSYLEQPVLLPKGKLGMPVPSLNRADVFLYVLCDLQMTEEQIADATKYWYALHTTYLLMDDVEDYKMDKQEKEENSVVELGDGNVGFDKAFGMLRSNINTMRNINPLLSELFERLIERLPDPIN